MYVIPTSTGGTSPQLTVHSLFEMKHHAQQEKGVTLMHRFFALFIFLYSTVLIITSPFALIEPFQNFMYAVHGRGIEVDIACLHMICSILLTVAKGGVHPYSRIVIVTLTISVAVQLGLNFEVAWWETMVGSWLSGKPLRAFVAAGTLSV
jgi:hypothetical protein